MKTSAPDLAAMMRFTTSEHELAALRVPTAVAAVVTDVAARMWPYKFVSHILEELLTSTAVDQIFNLQTLTPVLRLAAHATGVEVFTSRGTISASKVVLATNAYTSHLLPQFADLIVPCRGQMSSLVPLPSISGKNRLGTSLGFLGDGLDDYLIQRPTERGAHLMFGGGRQHGQSLGVTDDSVVDPDTAHYLRSRLLEALQLPEAGPNTHENEMSATHMWSGIMGFSRDDLPWVGQVPDEPHTYIAAGFTGHGMPNTWLSGKAVALLVARSLAVDAADATTTTTTTNEIEALQLAKQATGLPTGYVVTAARMQAALACADVESKDRSEMHRGLMPTRKKKEEKHNDAAAGR
jgi:glycine/D-amino acid oxidase-like deaminating enzyme